MTADQPDLDAAALRVALALNLEPKPDGWLQTWEGMGWLLGQMLVWGDAVEIGGGSEGWQTMFYRHDVGVKGEAEHTNLPAAVLLAADQALGGGGDARG